MNGFWTLLNPWILRIFQSLEIFWVSSVLLSAQEPQSALQALKLLPKAEARQLARIEAREGNPVPERWYFLIHDPAVANGLREFVVAGREIVAAREVSQFASRVQAGEVLGDDALQLDSGEVARLAMEYARANGKTIYALNFELSKDGEKAAPVWRVSCLNSTGESVGELSVTALLGNVVAHDGFLLAPRDISAPRVIGKKVATVRPEPKPEESPPPEPSPEWRANATAEDAAPKAPTRVRERREPARPAPPPQRLDPVQRFFRKIFSG